MDSLISSPAQTYLHTLGTAEHKSRVHLVRMAVLGVMAGMYVGIGVSVNSLVGGGLSHELRQEQPGLFSFLYSIFGFPTALTLIMVTGADLFTSTCCYVFLGIYERRVALLRAPLMLAVAYVSNFVGCLAVAGLMIGASVFSGRDAFLVEVATKKVSLSWAVCFAKGVLCNWYVNLAVWMANSARDLAGKFVGILLPISAFVVANGEHCVANMFLISVAMMRGADIGVWEFLGSNLAPTTLGNVVGGVMAAALFALAHSPKLFASRSA